jgi:hypothetical protein
LPFLLKKFDPSALPRRGVLRLVGLAAWPIWAGSQNLGQAVLPAAHSLRDELAVALKKKQPLLVMVSLEGCPYCRVARQSYLSPLQKNGAEIVQLDMNSSQPVQEFSGRWTTHGELVRQWQISITPMVLFFGPGGKEVAERLEGASLPDFYGAYLEQRLEKARLAL